MGFRLTVALVAVCCWGALSRPAYAADEIELIAPAGTTLRVTIDETIALTRVGQAVHGTLVEPLYAYDRIVIRIEDRAADITREVEVGPWQHGWRAALRRLDLRLVLRKDHGQATRGRGPSEQTRDGDERDASSSSGLA